MDVVADERITDSDSETLPPGDPAARVLGWVERHRRWLFAVIVVLYLAGFTGRWRINPDSAIYMALGRSLAEGGGYVQNGEHHTRYEPGLPVVIAASYRLFGEDRYTPILLFVLACSLTSLALTYRLMLRHAGRPTAALVTVGFGICETCVRYGFQVVTDTPFLVGVLVYLLAYERLVAPRASDRPKSRAIAWVAIPLATLFLAAFRPTALTFVGAVGVACAWHLYRGPSRARHVVIGLLTVAAFLSFRTIDPRRSTAGAEVKREQRLKALLTEQRSYFVPRIAREAHDFVEEVLPKAVFATEFAPGLDTAISLGVMASVIPLLRRRVLWAAWCAATFAQCMVWLPRERYLLPILPLVLYGMWLGTVWLSRRPRLSSSAAVSKAVVAVPLAAFVGCNLALDVHLLVQQRGGAGVARAGDADLESAPTLEMARQIASTIEKNDTGSLLYATDHDELSYFSRRRVDGTPWSGRWPPTNTELEEAVQRARAAPQVYVVLPDVKGEGDITNFIDLLGMKTGPALATVARPNDRKGKPVEPLTLYRLEPGISATTGPVDSH
jgi:hypothetical protein